MFPLRLIGSPGTCADDQGFHEQAVKVLREVTDLEPKNVKAWANLAFAYERAGRFQEAIAAGVRARQLSPRHHYVNLMLARVSFQLEQWRDAVTYARDADFSCPKCSQSNERDDTCRKRCVPIRRFARGVRVSAEHPDRPGDEIAVSSSASMCKVKASRSPLGLGSSRLDER